MFSKKDTYKFPEFCPVNVLFISSLLPAPPVNLKLPPLLFGKPTGATNPVGSNRTALLPAALCALQNVLKVSKLPAIVP